MKPAKPTNRRLIMLVGFVIIIAALWAYNRYTEERRNKQLAYNCKNKIWYNVPTIQFKGYPLSLKTTVIIKQNGQFLLNKLQLKAAKYNNSAVYELVALVADTALINKNDTILIAIGNEKHNIYGFTSDSYFGDHHILFCDELYQMDSKLFRTNEMNWIYKHK